MENALMAPVAGVDEVGRGPWAGPVVAGAVILEPASVPRGIDDSKKLSRGRREKLAAALRRVAHVGIGLASAGEIDELNILQAALLAMRRAITNLPVVPAHVLVDGRQVPRLEMPCTAVVGGDRRSLSIAAGSIVAKVYRDRLMARLADDHPGFGWEHNAGYGTREHREALSRFGVTPQHRRSFRPVAAHLDPVPGRTEFRGGA